MAEFVKRCCKCLNSGRYGRRQCRQISQPYRILIRYRFPVNVFACTIILGNVECPLWQYSFSPRYTKNKLGRITPDDEVRIVLLFTDTDSHIFTWSKSGILKEFSSTALRNLIHVLYELPKRPVRRNTEYINLFICFYMNPRGTSLLTIKQRQIEQFR